VRYHEEVFAGNFQLVEEVADFLAEAVGVDDVRFLLPRQALQNLVDAVDVGRRQKERLESTFQNICSSSHPTFRTRKLEWSLPTLSA